MPDQSPQRNSPGATRRRGWEHKAGSEICWRVYGLHVYISALNYAQCISMKHYCWKTTTQLRNVYFSLYFFGMFGLLKTELTCSRANQYNHSLSLQNVATCHIVRQDLWMSIRNEWMREPATKSFRTIGVSRVSFFQTEVLTQFFLKVWWIKTAWVVIESI